MTVSDTIILIPARMASTRLPGKPLLDIGGSSMIEHVWRRGVEAQLGRVVVACAEDEIAQAIRAAGGEAVLTEPDIPSGSDRIHQALARLDDTGEIDVVINLQGDLPLLDPTHLQSVRSILDIDQFDMSTLAALIQDPEEHENPNVVKAVAAFSSDMPIVGSVGRALYFSRASVPHGTVQRYHHIGIYGYRRAALAQFVSLPPSPLEKSEKLEQLRALENGMEIGVRLVDTIPFGVDTPADLQKARMLIQKR